MIIFLLGIPISEALEKQKYWNIFQLATHPLGLEQKHSEKDYKRNYIDL